MRWAVSLVCLVVGVLALAPAALTQQRADGAEPAPAGRHETPTQSQVPSSGGSAVNPAPTPAPNAAAAPAPAPTGQVYGTASFPRDASADLGGGVSVAMPALGPGLEVDPPVIDPTTTLSEERMSPRRWMTRSPNREFKVAGYKSFVGSVYKGCEQLCLREATCIAIEFRHSDQRCQLFDRREDSATTAESDIGFVRQQAAR